MPAAETHGRLHCRRHVTGVRKSHLPRGQSRGLRRGMYSYSDLTRIGEETKIMPATVYSGGGIRGEANEQRHACVTVAQAVGAPNRTKPRIYSVPVPWLLGSRSAVPQHPAVQSLVWFCVTEGEDPRGWLAVTRIIVELQHRQQEVYQTVS